MIDALTAQKYYDELDAVTGAERRRMEGELLAYADELERKEKEVADEHFSHAYTDPAYFERITSGPAVAQAERHSINNEEVRFESVNRAFLDYVYGRELGPDEYYAYRDSYAHSNFGKPEVGEKELYELIKGQFEWEQKKRTAANELFTSAVKDALEGALSGQRKSLVDTFSQWKDRNAELVDEEKDAEFLKAAMGVLAKTGDDLQAVAPVAARVWDSLARFTQGGLGEGDLQGVADELARFTPAQRQTAYRYAIIASQAEGDYSLSTLEQFTKNLGQSISRGFSFLEGPTLKGEGKELRYSYTPIDTIERNARWQLARLAKEKDSPGKIIEVERLNQAIEMTKVVRELKEVAKTGIDPIKPVFPEGKFLSAGTAERGIYGLAGSLGYMVASGINPALGTLAIAQGEYEQLRLQNPDMDPKVAGAAALASGVIQQYIERLQIRALTGKFPITGRFLDKLKAGITRTGLKIGAGLAEQNIQEAIQDAVSAGIPAVLSHLRQDMPDADLGKVMKDYAKQRGEVFFAVLPLGMISAGAATVSDFRDAGLTNKELRQFGFSEKQADAIQRSDNPTASIRAEAPLRTEKNIQAGIKDMQSDFVAAVALQQDQDLPTFESVTLEDGSREYQVVRPAPVAEDTAARSVATLTQENLAGKKIILRNVTMDAADANTMVQRNLTAYSALIDCVQR